MHPYYHERFCPPCGTDLAGCIAKRNDADGRCCELCDHPRDRMVALGWLTDQLARHLPAALLRQGVLYDRGGFAAHDVTTGVVATSRARYGYDRTAGAAYIAARRLEDGGWDNTLRWYRRRKLVHEVDAHKEVQA